MSSIAQRNNDAIMMLLQENPSDALLAFTAALRGGWCDVAAGIDQDGGNKNKNVGQEQPPQRSHQRRQRHQHQEQQEQGENNFSSSTTAFMDVEEDSCDGPSARNNSALRPSRQHDDDEHHGAGRTVGSNNGVGGGRFSLHSIDLTEWGDGHDGRSAGGLWCSSTRRHGPDESAASPYNLFRFFDRVFTVTAGADAPSDAEEVHSRSIYEIAAVLLFNMGVVYHRSAMSRAGPASAIPREEPHKHQERRQCEEQDRQLHMLSRALELYNLALSFLHPASSPSNGSGTSPPSPFCYCNAPPREDPAIRNSNILEMALYNNMGHIYSHYFCRLEASVCHDMILSRLGSPTPELSSPDADVFDSSLLSSCDENLFFSMNVLFYQFSSRQCASAA